MRRSGVTLVEVLIAIFVMGIGLLSLLTLFPLGALSMAQAIKDDRTAQAAANAAAIGNYHNVRYDPLVFNAFINPPPRLPPPGFPPPTPAGPSYPVYVDPFGAVLQQFPLAQPVFVGTPPSGIERVSPSWIVSNPQQQPYLIPRWFTLLDDIALGQNGLANPAGPFAIERAGRYSWAYLCRQMRFSQNQFDPVDLTVVVYAGRSLQLQVTAPTFQVAGESAYQAQFFGPPRPPLPPSSPLTTLSGTIVTLPSTIVTLTWNPATQPPQPAPAVHKGTWILDASLPQPPDSNDTHGYFYRVVSVDQVVQNTNGTYTMTVEIQTNARASAGWNPNGPPGLAIVMENVAEVFELGPK